MFTPDLLKEVDELLSSCNEGFEDELNRQIDRNRALKTRSSRLKNLSNLSFDSMTISDVLIAMLEETPEDVSFSYNYAQWLDDFNTPVLDAVWDYIEFKISEVELLKVFQDSATQFIQTLTEQARLIATQYGANLVDQIQLELRLAPITMEIQRLRATLISALNDIAEAEKAVVPESEL